MDVHGAGGRKFVVIEDSQVFATLTSCAIRTAFPGSHVEEFHSFQDVEMRLRFGDIDVVVCAYGLDAGKTAHDVRALCDAPMVVVTGRPDGIEPPKDSRVVTKMAGPVALRIAIQESLTARASEAWCPA
jgi:hypothetical protein